MGSHGYLAARVACSEHACDSNTLDGRLGPTIPNTDKCGICIPAWLSQPPHLSDVHIGAICILPIENLQSCNQLVTQGPAGE